MVFYMYMCGYVCRLLAIDFCISIYVCVCVLFSFIATNLKFWRKFDGDKTLIVCIPVYRISIRCFMQKHRLKTEYIKYSKCKSIPEIFSMLDRYGILAREISYERHNTNRLQILFYVVGWLDVCLLCSMCRCILYDI